MKRCWAKCIGTCSKKWSKEHIVSKSVFEGKTANVTGFDWTGKDSFEIPISKHYAHILCKKHNEELSPLDNEAKKIKNTFKLFYEEASKKFNNPTMNINACCKVNGHRFERWLLKTTINHLVYSPKRYSNYIPEHYLVELVFGQRNFDYDNKWGLYFVTPVLYGNLRQPTGTVAVMPIKISKEERQILLGSVVIVFGCVFFIKVVTTNNLRIDYNGSNLMDEKMYHPNEIGLFSDGIYDNTIKLKFDYSQTKIL